MAGKSVVVVLFGGRSSEHSISCATAGGILGAIDRTRFDVIPVGITRDGAFVLEVDDPARFALDPAALPEVVDNGTRVRWPERVGDRTLTVVLADGSSVELGDVDVVFPILHGRFGEDGTVQGFLELCGLPYVGSGVLASAVAMDKHVAKTILEHAGLPVAPWIRLTAAEYAAMGMGDSADGPGVPRVPRGGGPGVYGAGSASGSGLVSGISGFEESVSALGLPVFVKPARAGSSVGVTKVTELGMLAAAIETAFAEDHTVLIEAAMVGREIELGVLGGLAGGPPRASVAGEIVVTGRDFYDFDAKYLAAPGVELVCPAVLPEGALAELQALAVRAFSAIGAAGLARVDTFHTADGFVINEINTMPGFTPISMFPKCWQASGLGYTDLITELITLAQTTPR
ncbi:MAG: D-alanine--D-alanine ligase family protein [Microbacteriaceae bacterium]